MDLRHAKTFVTVAELGTVSKASQHLRIAQPALSRQIAALEDELGLRLFDRIGRRLLITAEGQQLLGNCRALLACATAIGEHAQSLQAGDTGVLKVAAGPQFIEGVLAEFLRVFADRYPKVTLKLVEAIGWVEIVGLLERGDVHLGQNLLRAERSDEPRFGCQRLAPVDLLAAYRSANLFASRGSVDIARVAAHPLLVLDTSYVFRRSFDAACRLAGLTPNIVYESRTPQTLLSMAESGHGVAVVPSTMHIARHPVHISAITYRGKPLREPLAVYWDKRRPLPRYAITFSEMLAAYVRDHFPISRPKMEKRVLGKRR